MTPVLIKSKKARLSFFVTSELSDKINKISKQYKLTVSEITCEAIRNYIQQIEKVKTERELETGYEANYDYYLRSQKDWEYAEK